MYLENDTKFYEIALIKNDLYIHFGRIPNFDSKLPFGTLKKYNIQDKNKRKDFYNKKINEKIQKGYEIIKKGSSPTHDMKEMIKIKS